MIAKRYLLFDNADEGMRFHNALNHLRERSARTEMRDGAFVVWAEGWLPEKLAAIRLLLNAGRGPRTLTDACVEEAVNPAQAVAGANPYYVGYDAGIPITTLLPGTSPTQPEEVEFKQINTPSPEVDQVSVFPDTKGALRLLCRVLGRTEAEIVEELVNDRLREQFSKL